MNNYWTPGGGFDEFEESKKDEIIEWLIDTLEEEHLGSREHAREYILENWGLEY